MNGRIGGCGPCRRRHAKAGPKEGSPRGFTLYEMMVTVAILSVIAGLGITGIMALRPKSDLYTLTADLVSQLEAAKHRAAIDGAHVWFGWVSEGDFVGYVVCETQESSRTPPPNYDPDAPCGADMRLVVRREVPRAVSPAAGASFSAAGLDRIPRPFRNAIDLQAVPGSGCSFCPTGGGSGWLRFLPRGEVQVVAGQGRMGAGLVLHLEDALEDAQGRQAVLITTPYGLVGSFSDE